MATATRTAPLFAGRVLPHGGLSNEAELIIDCPREFRQDNDWSVFIRMMYTAGADRSGWKWKSRSKTEKKKQFICFGALLKARIMPEDRVAVAAWMLSEMLVEVPVHSPGPKL